MHLDGIMLWGIAAYFVLAVIVLALLMLPALRDSLWARLRRYRVAGRRQVDMLATASHHSRHLIHNRSALAEQSARDSLDMIARRKWLAAGLTMVIIGPPMIALSLRRWNVLEFADDTRDVNEQIATLLRGEQLVPPAPLPPELFVTAEVVTARPNLVTASRDWGLLDADFKQRLLLAYRLMQQNHGYEMALLEGYRSPERQRLLLSSDSEVVTHAAAYQSYHQYGLAADSAFYRDGRLVISERDPWAMRGYELFGEVVAQLGLAWGGKWKLRDYGHVELRRAGVLGKQ